MQTKTKDTIIRHLKGIVAALGEGTSFLEMSNKQLKQVWAISTGNGISVTERQKLLDNLKEEMKSRDLL